METDDEEEEKSGNGFQYKRKVFFQQAITFLTYFDKIVHHIFHKLFRIPIRHKAFGLVVCWNSFSVLLRPVLGLNIKSKVALYGKYLRC